MMIQATTKTMTVTPSIPPGAVSDEILARVVRSVDYRCRRDAHRPERVESRWCHHFGARHPTVGPIPDSRNPRVRDERRPTDRRDEHADGSHSCRHADQAHSEPVDRALDAARHPNTNPRCRRRRHPMHPTSPTRRVPWAHRRSADEDASPNQWVTRERVAATRRWPARSSAAMVRYRSRNSTGRHRCDQPVRRRRSEVHRNRRREHRRARRVPRRRYGATCRRSSIPPALRRRAVPALSSARPGRSCRRGRA